MNILILSLYAPSRNVYSGGREVIFQLSKRWIKKGHNVKIISTSKDKDIPEEENLDDIKIKRVGSFYNAIPSIMKAYKNEENWAEIVIENYTSYPLYTPLFVKKHLVVLMHHLMGEDFIKSAGLNQGIAGFLCEKTIPIIYKKSQFITVSNFTRNQLETLGIPVKNLNVIPNGIDSNYYVPGHKQNYPLILFIGNFGDGRKRVEELITAFNIVSEKISDAELVIVGKGGKKEITLNKICKKNTKVKYLGIIDEESKKELYQKAWVFANPSIKEGFCLSCLEANACGTPVLTYRLEGLETINHEFNGLIIEQRDVRGLANAIIKLLLDHKLRNNMSKNARIFAEGFNWDSSTDKYLEIFDKYTADLNI